MIVYLNGRFLPAESATISVFDRGFLYGDGLFESVRVYANHLFLWPDHADRLVRGAAALRLPLPETTDRLREAAEELLRRNQLSDAILRMTVSRGPGPRGYSIRGADTPTVVLAVYPAPALTDTPPPAWRLITSRHRLPAADPVARFKTAHKLLHVLARAEAEEGGADEALLLNTDGHVTETSAANVFWWHDRTLSTPSLDAGGLAGVTRRFVMDQFRAAGWEVREILATPEDLRRASGVFLTLSSWGIVGVRSLDRTPWTEDPRLQEFQRGYRVSVRDAIENRRICH